MASLRPAKYGYGEGKSYINCNRDKQFEDGFWMQALDPAGFSDKTVAVLKFEDLEGNLIGAFANYCCHATVAFCVYDVDGKGKITSGFPGIACSYIENRYDNEPVIIWSSGAAGDQNPIGTSEGYPRIYEKDGYSESIATPPGTQYMIQRHVGYTHAIDIIETMKTIECRNNEMRISGTKTVVELVGQKAPEGADMQYNRLLVDNFLRAYRPELFEGGKRPEKKLVEMVPHGINPLNMQLAILGDVAFVGAAAEIYCQIGAHLKKESPFKKTVVVTHNGPCAGYIISDEAPDHKVFQSYAKTYPGNNNKPITEGMLGMFNTLLNS